MQHFYENSLWSSKPEFLATFDYWSLSLSGGRGRLFILFFPQIRKLIMICMTVITFNSNENVNNDVYIC